VLEGIVLNEELIGTNLHYWRGRSRPCTGNDCDACKHGQKPRWKGYVFIYGERSKRTVIFEFTERAFGPFDAYFTEHGTLRGAKLKASRLSKKENGPIHVVFDDANYDRPNLPKPTDLRGVLERMWEINENANVQSRGSVYDETTIAELQGGNKR
jgi:hypothetical protein